MTMFLKMFSVLAIVFSFAISQADEAKPGPLAADKAEVKNDCKSEAATAGCGSEEVGTGLLKCIHAYKKSHPDFKVSDACKTSIKTLHQDHDKLKASKGK